MTEPTLTSVLLLLESDYLPQAEARAAILWLVEQRADLQDQRDGLVSTLCNYRDLLAAAETAIERLRSEKNAAMSKGAAS